MTKRRSRGDGGLHWDEARQRWIASVTVGYTPAGKRIVRKANGKTKPKRTPHSGRSSVSTRTGYRSPTPHSPSPTPWPTGWRTG